MLSVIKKKKKSPSYLVACTGEVDLSNANSHSKSRHHAFLRSNLSEISNPIERIFGEMFGYLYIFDDFLNQFLGHHVKNYNWLNDVLS